METINQINREELKTRLDRGEKVKLVMTMNGWAYNRAHIPGSTYVSSTREALVSLDPNEEIIVYCTGQPCPASLNLYWRLKQKGYRRVRYYAGGLLDWDAAGYPLEGEITRMH